MTVQICRWTVGVKKKKKLAQPLKTNVSNDSQQLSFQINFNTASDLHSDADFLLNKLPLPKDV